MGPSGRASHGTQCAVTFARWRGRATWRSPNPPASALLEEQTVTRQHACLVALSLTLAGCGTPLADVADELRVWVRQGYRAEEALFVSVGTNAESEGNCPSFSGLVATASELQMSQSDAGGWYESLLGEDHCTPATFVLTAAELTELSHGAVTLRLEDSSYGIEIDLPTLGMDRTMRVLEPADGQLARGQEVRVEMGAAGDTLESVDAWISVPELCVPTLEPRESGNNEASWELVTSTCAAGTQGTLYVKAQYALGIGEVRGMEHDQASGVSYVSADLPVELVGSTR